MMALQKMLARHRETMLRAFLRWRYLGEPEWIVVGDLNVRDLISDDYELAELTEVAEVAEVPDNIRANKK